MSSLENCAMLYGAPEKTVKANGLHQRLTKNGNERRVSKVAGHQP